MAKKEELRNAFNVVNQVCAEFRGSLQDHQNIQHALSEIKKFIETEKQFKKGKNEKK